MFRFLCGSVMIGLIFDVDTLKPCGLTSCLHLGEHPHLRIIYIWRGSEFMRLVVVNRGWCRLLRLISVLGHLLFVGNI